MTKEQKKLQQYIDQNGIEKLFVHAGSEPATEQQSWIYLFVKISEYNSIESYGDILTIFSSDIATPVLEIGIIEDLKEDYDNDLLSPDLDSFLNNVDWENLDDQINPPDIVDDAAFWDCPSFVTWFSEKYSKIPGVETNDGMAIVWAEDFSKNFSVVFNDFDELDEVMTDNL